MHGCNPLILNTQQENDCLSDVIDEADDEEDEQELDEISGDN